MYGLIGRIEAKTGEATALADLLVDSVAGLPGCRSYIVAIDAENPDSIWVTEVWESQEHHQASLSLPAVAEAIGKGRPMIAGFSARHETRVVGGHGV